MTADEIARRRRGGSTASTCTKLDFRVASQPAERLAALRLVHQRYTHSGLIDPCQLKLRVMPQHLLPTTSIFVGTANRSVHCTVSLICDNRERLPLEDIYAAEVEHLRRSGRHLAEVSCLAFSSYGPSASFRNAFVPLIRVMAQFARHHGVTSLLMATNPRHQLYYERLMGFRRIGRVKTYPSVCNHPAVACLLDFDAVDCSHPPLYEAIFGEPLPVEVLARSAMTPAELRLLRLASTIATRLMPLSA
jgi:hypothetical protein